MRLGGRRGGCDRRLRGLLSCGRDMLGLQVDLAQNVWKDATSKQTDGQTGIRQVGKPENMDHRDA